MAALRCHPERSEGRAFHDAKGRLFSEVRMPSILKLAKIAARKSVPKKKAPALKPTDPKRVAEILKRLEKAYPDAKCALVHNNPLQLLIATILSAQCTDVRVNMVTPELFKKYPTVHDFAALRPEVLEPDIRSTGFYRNKAKSIVGAAQRIVKEYGGKVPRTMEELLTLPGVARKTANVVLGNAFDTAVGVVVDTHVQRVSRRLALTKEESPEKIEKDLMKLIAQDKWVAFSHEVIFHGRQVCIARKPKCAQCPVEDLCFSLDKTV
jgi:endonuclease III